MRRILAIWLLLALAFPVLSPLLASVTETESAVPVCCRKGGAHHCLGSMPGAAGQDARVSVAAPRCAEFPKAVAPSHGSDFFLSTPAPAFAEDVAFPSITWQAEALARVALDRARRKRGPPAVPLS